MELEKKEAASGSLASERGEEPRSGKLDNECFLCFRLPPAKKRVSHETLSVELEGVEPSSKQLTDVLSTCLSDGWLSGRLRTSAPKATRILCDFTGV